MVKALSKCQFWLKEVSYLVHILLAKRIAIDPSKVQEALEWKSPTSVTEIRSFLGLPGYYRRFTQRFLQSFEAHDRRPQTVIKLKNYHDANEVDDTNREVLPCLSYGGKRKTLEGPNQNDLSVLGE